MYFLCIFLHVYALTLSTHSVSPSIPHAGSPPSAAPHSLHSLQNRTHFMYKLDNLFRSIRVLDENSSVTRALQCFLNLFELQTFLHLV